VARHQNHLECAEYIDKYLSEKKSKKKANTNANVDRVKTASEEINYIPNPLKRPNSSGDGPRAKIRRIEKEASPSKNSQQAESIFSMLYDTLLDTVEKGKHFVGVHKNKGKVMNGIPDTDNRPMMTKKREFHVWIFHPEGLKEKYLTGHMGVTVSYQSQLYDPQEESRTLHRTSFKIEVKINEDNEVFLEFSTKDTEKYPGKKSEMTIKTSLSTIETEAKHSFFRFGNYNYWRNNCRAYAHNLFEELKKYKVIDKRDMNITEHFGLSYESNLSVKETQSERQEAMLRNQARAASRAKKWKRRNGIGILNPGM